ncbi:MAG: pyruvate:ferredoxin (flavodoxin) oxidoreductase, partial [Oscillospiraceae bacterium]|nr:pyruvate:ferredoxin (flavodoxin) oxidoreductase [Oscillospiraceae bacterium]
VGANKNSIKIIGDNTDMYAQAYFDYDSKKSGGVTMSHLRFGKSPIKSTYLITKANFVACHNPAYIRKYNMVQELVDGGTFLLNCPWDMEGIEKHLPGQVKKFMADHNIKFYVIDGIKIGKEIGLGGRINTVLQSAFFKLANIIPEEHAIELMKAAAKATYGRKGDKIVQMNYDAIDAGAKQVVEVAVPAEWTNAQDEGLDLTHTEKGRPEVVDFVNNIQAAVSAQEGNKLPVSAFVKYMDGTTPSGTSAYEKRGIAVDIPVWNAENCIQCNRCSYVCPHAVIRPVALTDEEAAAAPEGLQTLPLTGMKDPAYKFSIVVSALDCTGCGSCVNVCPGKKGNKAITMQNMEANQGCQAAFDYAAALPIKTDVVEKFKENTVKGSQFKQPLLEFSGACAGCGETPYAKLITQLFGERMYIANATGCSSIWGNSSPSTPYTVNAKGQGPAWSNSLFEDNAEFGYGMLLATKALRGGLKERIEALAEKAGGDVKAAADEWVETFNCGSCNGAATDKLIAALEACGCDEAKAILKDKDYLAKKSQWILGGDGWAYDIGFGGVDHVLASGEDINVLVFDTEVYSNTGGQASKATQPGAVAQFAAAGKEVKKKDLASIAMSYGYIYVAQIAMGADFNQTVKALAEAEAYPGPSLVIAYAPCINHGIKKGMSKSQTEEQLAVEAGYWHLFRFNPAAESKFTLDSKAPTGDLMEFLDGEVRYNSLKRANPARAEKLFAKNAQYNKERYEYLSKLIGLYAAE